MNKAPCSIGMLALTILALAAAAVVSQFMPWHQGVPDWPQVALVSYFQTTALLIAFWGWRKS